MGLPESAAFDGAIQNLPSTMADPELRDGEVTRRRLGLPLRWTGNFAKVYRVHCPKTDNTWAVKCFTRAVRDRQVRYPQIAAHLNRARLPFTVDFEYLEEGIRVEGNWYPIVKMRWVEGFPLNRFVEDHLDRPEMLRQLLQLWRRLARMLREAGVAHADLQHGNVLLVPHEGGQLALRLVDYDGMYVPGLEGTDSGERGHPAYQHPQRIREGTYNAEVDRFSHLLIYTAVRCLTSERKDLWRSSEFNNGDNLLFRQSDLDRPGESELFQRLWASPDLEVRDLVGRLALACYDPLEQTPLLDEILSDGDGTVQPLEPSEESTAHELLGAGQDIAQLGNRARAKELVELVKACYEKGDYDGAIAYCSEAIQLDPNSYDAYFWRARSYELEASEFVYEQFVCEDAFFPFHIEKAIADYTEAIRLNLEPALAYEDRGDAYRQMRDYDRAIADYTEVIRLFPKSARAYNKRADAYRQMGDYDRAIADYTEAIRLDPKYPPYRPRGDAYWIKGDYDRAIADYTEVIRLFPKSVRAYNDRALAYKKKGDHARANLDFVEAERLGYKPK